MSRREEFRVCASIALDFCPESWRTSYELVKTVRIASDTVWLRFDGSIRLRFSSAIRTKSPTQLRLTLGLGNRGPRLVSNYFWYGLDVRFAG